jgi:hypothetical protein
VCLAALTAALIESGPLGWLSPIAEGCLATSALALCAFLVAAAAPDPIAAPPRPDRVVVTTRRLYPLRCHNDAVRTNRRGTDEQV